MRVRRMRRSRSTDAGRTDGVEERSDPVCRGGPQYPATTPSKGTKISLNTIGGEKWTSVGSTLAWEVQVEQSGLYEIRLRCRQNYSQGFYSTRSLLIDGETPFREAENLRFVYKRGWQQVALGDAQGSAYKFYFEAEGPTPCR